MPMRASRNRLVPPERSQSVTEAKVGWREAAARFFRRFEALEDPMDRMPYEVLCARVDRLEDEVAVLRTAVSVTAPPSSPERQS